MKNLKLILVTVIMMMTVINKTNAKDIYVEENGFGGAFTSIFAASNAAGSGDRVLVVPRANNAFYEELGGDINLSCEILSAVPGQRFRFSIDGSISFSGNGHMSQAEINAYGEELMFDGSPWITNCKITDAAIVANSSIHFDNDSIISAVLNLYQGGRVSGCYFGNTGVNIYFNSNDGDTILIVGNWFSNYWFSNYSLTIGNGNGSYQCLYIANNYFDGGISIGSLCSNSGGQTGMNTIANNLFVNSCNITIANPDNIPSNLNIENNLFVSANCYISIASINGSNVKISYNYLRTGGYAGFTNDGTNNFNSNTTIDGQGHLQSGSDAINGGDPSVNYLDLDLTRNDGGMYGGSFSMSNFNTQGIGNPRVLFMTAPRSAFTTQSVNISADGVAK